LCCASVGAPHSKSPPDGNNSRIPYSEGSLPHKQNFLKFKHENVIKMKNKPAPALLRPSNLSNEIKKRVPKSRETIPLKSAVVSFNRGVWVYFFIEMKCFSFTLLHEHVHAIT
jgi:hypothetical protein